MSLSCKEDLERKELLLFHKLGISQTLRQGLQNEASCNNDKRLYSEVIQFVNRYLTQTHLVLIIVLVKEIPGLLFLLDHLVAGRQWNLFPFRVKLLRD